MINYFLNRLADITYLQYVYIWVAPSATNNLFCTNTDYRQ